jgi:PEGA domain
MLGRRPAPLALVCSALVVIAGLAPPAWADGRSRAAALKHKADQEMENLHYGEALEDYTQAYAITHDPAILYNRARVLEALERFSEAVQELDRFVHDAPPELKARVPKLAELRNELEAHVASLVVRCGVEGSRILVRKQLVATTPVNRPIPVNAGHAVLEVIADGFAPFTQEIDLPGGQTTEIQVKLEPSAPAVAGPAQSALSVTATPEGSEVFVDGKPFGHAPVEGLVSPGKHEIVVTHSGFQDKKTFAAVEENERRELSLTLEKKSITSAWWFWTGIAAVGAGAATVAIVLAVHKSAGDGTLGRATVPDGPGAILRF